MITILALMTDTAVAYRWGIGPPGPNFNYHVCTDDFTSAEESEIELGANAWDAGADEILRGANVNVWRDSDRTIASGQTCSSGNGFDEVYARPEAWLSQHFCGNALACTLPGLPFPDTDIIFNDSLPFCTETPSHPDCDGEFSIGQTMVHEIGHKIGFIHENDNIATMNENYPSGGDINRTKYRIHEDDSVGLQAHKGDSSTGRNLMIQRFGYDGDGEADETWVSNSTYDKSSSVWSQGGAPEFVQAIIEGTSTQSPLIQWRVEVSTSAECWDGIGTEYVVGSRTPTIGPNIPYEVSPTLWNFTNVPVGTYKLCAMIDADDAITETAEGDNKMRGEMIVTVQQ